MTEFKVIRLNTGESFLGIVKEETNEYITVLFPMILSKQTIQMTDTLMREVHTTTSFCPFTDDKEFVFQKRNLMFVKSMNQEAVPYYVDMLNRHEEEERLLAYNLNHLIKPKDFGADLLEHIENDNDELEELQNFESKVIH
jgi:hypothetical protein